MSAQVSRVYAIASGKGGVGKTTTTVNLGVALARAGVSVAVVDADLGMANVAEFVGLDADPPTLHDVLAGEATVEEATYRLVENAAVVPSGTDLARYADTSPEGLGDVVETLRDEFEYVLLDVGAGMSHETVLPLGLADAVVVVSTPEPASVGDATKTVEVVDRVGTDVAGVVLTRTRTASDAAAEVFADRIDAPLLGSVPDDPAVRDSVSAGRPLVAFDPSSPAARAYLRIAGRIADVDVPIPGTDPRDDSTGSDSNADDDSPYDVSSVITDAEDSND